MLRASFATSFVVTLVLALSQFPLASPGFAGLKQDLAKCTSGKGKASVYACSRVIQSGRLKRSNYYIAYYNRAWGHRNAGALEAALIDLNKSLKYNSKFADTYYSRSVVRYEQADLDGALQDLDSYVKRKSGNWKAYYKRALMLRRLGEVDRALEDLDRAQELKASAKGIRFLKALVLSDQGEHDSALELIGRDLAQECRDAQECYSRAVVLHRKDLHDEALADLDKAVEIRKTYAASYTMKGSVLELLGRRAEAKRSFEKSISLDVRSVEELLAQKEARAALAALQVSDKLPVAKSEMQTTKKTDTAFACRRFIPISNTTISVPCGR